MKRKTLLNYLAAHRGYRSYLEIGCNRNGTFQHVAVPHRVGIDPNRGGTLRMTSDEFFAVNSETFDLVFVDGLHLHEQVVKDVDNALRCLAAGGCIVIHDCLPTAEEQQLCQPPGGGKPWTGDVWKAVVESRQRADVDVAVLDADWGLGVLFARPNTDRLPQQGELDWSDFAARRNSLLRVVDAGTMLEFIEGRRVVAKADAASGDAPRCGRSPDRATLVDREVSPCDGDHASTAVRGRETRAQHDPFDAVVRQPNGPVFVFAHSNLAQFRTLHEYLNRSGLATSYLLCSENNYRKHGDSVPNLIPFKPHGGKLKSNDAFYYLTRVEGANRRSLGILTCLQSLLQRTRVDLFVGHVTAGSP